MAFRELGVVSLPPVARCGSQSAQPLQRELARSVMGWLLEGGLSLGLQVFWGGRVSDPTQPLPHLPAPPHTLLTRGTGESGAGSVPRTPHLPGGSPTSTHKQGTQQLGGEEGTGAVAWRGRLPGGLGVVLVQGPSWRPLHPRGPGRRGGRGR